MDDHGTNAGYIGSLQCPADGIVQERRPEPPALPSPIDGKAGKKHYRNRMTRNTLVQALRNIVINNVADDKGMKSDNFSVTLRHIGLRDIRTLPRQSIQTEKTVERFTPAIEIHRIMAGCKLDYDGFFIHAAGSVQDGWFIEKTFHTRMRARRRVESLHECGPLLGVQADSGAFRQHGVRGIKRTFKHELADSRMPFRRCLLQQLTRLSGNSDIEALGS